jgi:hypothetical protein
MDETCSMCRWDEKLPQNLCRKASVGKILGRSWCRWKEIVKYVLQTHDYFVNWINPRVNLVEKEMNLRVPKTTGVFFFSSWVLVFQDSLCREADCSSPILANYRHCRWCFPVLPPECRLIRQFKTVDISEPSFSCDPAKAQYKHGTFSCFLLPRELLKTMPQLRRILSAMFQTTNEHFVRVSVRGSKPRSLYF